MPPSHVDSSAVILTSVGLLLFAAAGVIPIVDAHRHRHDRGAEAIKQRQIARLVGYFAIIGAISIVAALLVNLPGSPIDITNPVLGTDITLALLIFVIGSLSIALVGCLGWARHRRTEDREIRERCELTSDTED